MIRVAISPRFCVLCLSQQDQSFKMDSVVEWAAHARRPRQPIQPTKPQPTQSDTHRGHQLLEGWGGVVILVAAVAEPAHQERGAVADAGGGAPAAGGPGEAEAARPAQQETGLVI